MQFQIYTDGSWWNYLYYLSTGSVSVFEIERHEKRLSKQCGVHSWLYIYTFVQIARKMLVQWMELFYVTMYLEHQLQHLILYWYRILRRKFLQNSQLLCIHITHFTIHRFKGPIQLVEQKPEHEKNISKIILKKYVFSCSRPRTSFIVTTTTTKIIDCYFFVETIEMVGVICVSIFDIFWVIFIFIWLLRSNIFFTTYKTRNDSWQCFWCVKILLRKLHKI